MKQINCLNLTEIIQYLYTAKNNSVSDFKTIVSKSNELAGFEKCERIYLGSYFCAQYFLNLPKSLIKEVKAFCEENGTKLTLVLPTFTEKNLERGKYKIAELILELKGIMDEITVNDYGMLTYIPAHYNVHLNMGRVFMKDYRDLRYPEYFNMTLKPKIFTTYFEDIMKDYNVKGVEFDPTHSAINFEECPNGLEVGVHMPYCYMTVGQICEFASIHKTIDKKFRPNTTCQGECNTNIFKYNFNDGHDWLRVGRAIYFENKECKLEGIDCVRKIYFPVDLVVKQ